MDEQDIIRFMGKFPDKIDPRQRLMSKRWECSQCGNIREFEQSVTSPTSCPKCGGIFFVKIEKRKDG